MSEITCSGAAVTRGVIYLPLSGVWVADLDVDTDTELAGRVSITADEQTLSGTVVRGAVSHGLWHGRIVGGAAGLRAELTARAYRGAVLADVLADVLAEAGESADASSAALDIAAPLWHRLAGTAADTVAAVARAAGLVWRVTTAGLVWLGAETWPDAPDSDVTLLATDPRRGVYTVSGDVLGILPGLLWLARDEAADTGVRVGDVRHEIDGQTVTTRITAAS